MPIKIPDDLPATKLLQQEGVLVIEEKDAIRQDIRPIKIALLNLMPQKEITETQLARLIGATPLQVELTLLCTGSYTPTNITQSHLEQFYQTWDDIKDSYFDGLIITGAPVELLNFEDVKYWQELTNILDWARYHVFSNLFICWGAQAGIYHYRSVPKYILHDKAFGIYKHRIIDPLNPCMRGFTDEFLCPVSRHTEVRLQDIEHLDNIELLAYSDETGVCLVEDKTFHSIYMFNHLEYDSETLAHEYHRDKSQGKSITIPYDYFPDDNPECKPVNLWRSYAHLFVGNWINHIYQHTPYHLADIAKRHK